MVNQPTPELFKELVTTGAVTFFYCINLLGLRMSSRVQNILTIFKIMLVAAVVDFLFGHHPVGDPRCGSASGGESGPGGWLKALGLADRGVFHVWRLSADHKFRRRCPGCQPGHPRGISSGVVLIIILYLAINFVYVKVIGFEHSSRPIRSLRT